MVLSQPNKDVLHAIAFGRIAGPKLKSCQRLRHVAGHHLAELETSAWLDDRRFRLMCFTNDTMAFSDLYFHTASNPRREHRAAFKARAYNGDFAVTSEDPTQQVAPCTLLLI